MRTTVEASLAIVIALGAAAYGRKGDAPKQAPDPTQQPDDEPAAAIANLTPNAVLAQGPPTIVIGTLGDDAADRVIATQAALVQGLFPHATIVPDTSIDVAAGPSAWPPRPMLYGGAHVNAVIAALGDRLPVDVNAGRIVLGGETYAGPGDHVITVIPASSEHPAFLLYAGTGTPGVVEINGQRHGPEPIVIGDAHGRLRAGTWVHGVDGKVTAAMGPRARRIAWRQVPRVIEGATIQVAFPAQLPAATDEAQVIDAILRGLVSATERLDEAAPPPMTVYVYPDRRSKEALTGFAGDGHAMALASALHVIRFDPTPGGGLELLMAHEGTHLITQHRWAPAGSSLLGEGLAVWASGQYGGVSLAEWRTRLTDRPAAATLLPSRAFRALPEAETYPFAGLLVSAALEQVGLAAVRDHLFPATADTWAEACQRAGTTAEALDAAVTALR